MNPQTSHFFAVTRATLLAAASTCVAHAGDGTWVTNGNGNWSDSVNWSGGTGADVADGASSTANFSNDLTVDATVTLDSARTIGNLNFQDASPGTPGGWTLAGANVLTLSGGTPTITVDNLGAGKSAAISSAITGGAGLAKAGAGTLVLTGANTYTNGTAINAGTLQIGNGAVNGTIGSGTYSIAPTTTLFLNYATAATPPWANMSGAGTIRLNSAQAVNGSANWGLMALPAGFTGTLQIDKGRVNSGTAQLGGCSTVVLGDGAQFLAFDNNSTSSYNYSQAFSLNGLGWGEAGQNNGALRASVMNATFSGNITLTGNSGIYLQGNAGGVLTVTGPISGGFNLSLFNGQAATANLLTLSGTNTYSGTTTIANGIVRFAKTASLYNNNPASWTATNLIVNSGTTAAFNVGGVNEFTAGNIDTLKGLGSGTGGFKDGARLGIDTTNAGGTFSYSSIIANPNGGANALGLNKLGTGTLTLSGANTYTGVTTVTAGTLSVASLANGGIASNIGAATNAAANLVLSGGTLQYTGPTASTDRAFTQNVASTLEVANGATTLTIANPVNAAGGSLILTKTGPGTLVLGGSADNSSLYLALSTGEVQLAKSVNNMRAMAGISSIAAGATVKLTGAGNDQIYDGNAGANYGLNGLAGTLDLNGHSEVTSNFNGTATTGLVTNGAAATNVTWTVGSTNATSAFAGVVQDGAGSVALVKTGSGTQTLSGPNTYTGGTTVNGGILSLDYGTVNGSKLADGGALTLNAGTTLQLTGGALGTHTELVGPVTINGNVSITRSGANTAKIALGGFTNNGILNVGGTGLATTTVPNSGSGYLPGVTFAGNQLATNSGGDIVAATATYDNFTRLNSGPQLLAAPSVAGAITRIVDGTGTAANITIPASTLDINTMLHTATGGATTVDLTGGTLRLAANGSIITAAGSGALTIQNGILTAGGATDAPGTLTLQGGSANALTVSSQITDNGLGAVAVNSTGNVVLSGATNSFTGGTTVNAGVLAFASGALGTTGAITMNGGTLQWSGLNTQDISARLALVNGKTATFDTGANNPTFASGIGNSSSATLAKSGAGTLSLGGANTYTGPTTVNAGTLTISGTGSLTGGNYANNIVNNATFNWSSTTPQIFSGQIAGTGVTHVTAGAVTISGSAASTGEFRIMPSATGTTVDHATGTYNFAEFSLFQNNVSNGTATYNQSGGALNVTGTFQLGHSTVGNSSNDTDTANITGGTITAGTVRCYKWANCLLNISGTANVTGGTLYLGWVDSLPSGTITVGNGTPGGTLAWGDATIQPFRNYTLNLNGGTIKATKNNTAWLPTAAFVTAAVQDTGSIVDNGGFAPTIGQVLSHGGVNATDGGLTFTGAGTTTLTGTNTYNGPTTVSAGTLLLSATGATGSGTVTVQSGATLGGTGSASGATTINAGATVAPGASAGTLTLDSATLAGTYQCQLDGSNGDLLAVTGALTINPGAAIIISTLAAPTAPSYTILSYGSLTGTLPTIVPPSGYAVDTATPGQVKLVQATNGYNAWAATNAPTGTTTDDYDQDGVNNAVEWVLGGLASTRDITKLPTLNATGANMVFTFVRNDAAWQSGDTTVQIEVGTTLGAWPSIYNVGINTAASSPGVTITDTGSTDTVTLTVPKAPDAKKFARLKVTITP